MMEEEGSSDLMVFWPIVSHKINEIILKTICLFTKLFSCGIPIEPVLYAFSFYITASEDNDS
jgi:hypothetical protein